MRSLLNQEEKQKLLEEVRNSGHPQAVFAEGKGINPKALDRWIYQASLEERQNQSDVEFVALRL